MSLYKQDLQIQCGGICQWVVAFCYCCIPPPPHDALQGRDRWLSRIRDKKFDMVKPQVPADKTPKPGLLNMEDPTTTIPDPAPCLPHH